LRSLLAKPHFIVLVALSGTKVVGGLVAYVLEKFEQERQKFTFTTSPSMSNIAKKVSQQS
jgi:hypothetical protein